MVQILINLELFPIGFLARIYFQSYRMVGSISISLGIGKDVADLLKIIGEPYHRSDPKSEFTNDLVLRDEDFPNVHRIVYPGLE